MQCLQRKFQGFKLWLTTTPLRSSVVLENPTDKSYNMSETNSAISCFTRITASGCLISVPNEIHFELRNAHSQKLDSAGNCWPLNESNLEKLQSAHEIVLPVNSCIIRIACFGADLLADFEFIEIHIISPNLNGFNRIDLIQNIAEKFSNFILKYNKPSDHKSRNPTETNTEPPLSGKSNFSAIDFKILNGYELNLCAVQEIRLNSNNQIFYNDTIVIQSKIYFWDFQTLFD